VTEGCGRNYLAFLLQEAGQGRLTAVPPLPERAAELFGETGWLRHLTRAVGGDAAFRDSGLPGQLAAAERVWRWRLGELLDKLTRIEAIASDLDEDDPATEDRKHQLRADIAVIAGQVHDLSQRDARGLLTELGLLAEPAEMPGPAGPARSHPHPPLADGLTARLVNLLGYWAWPSATIAHGTVPQGELRLRQADGSMAHWQVSVPTGTRPDLVLRRLEAEPMEVAVFLDRYEQHAAPACNSLAADAAARAQLRATGTVVFQLTADEAAALVEGGGAPHVTPYEADAQAAARRGYRALGGDPAALEDMIWRGSARTLLAFLTRPDRDHWREVATAALAGLLIRPGSWRTGLTAEDFAERLRACLMGDPLPASPGREQTLVRVLDTTGCPVTVLTDQRGAGPAAPLGSWTGLAVLDDRLVAIRASEPAHRRRWAGWLWWGNLLQFTGGRQLAYTTLGEFDPRTLTAFSWSSPQVEAAWDGQVEVIDREVAVLAEALAYLGVPAPAPDQVGHELGDEAWQAEIAWPQARVAVLAGGPGSGVTTAEVADCAAAYRAAGWDARPARDWPPDELAVRILEAGQFLASRGDP
jgi:hypothetical protein